MLEINKNEIKVLRKLNRLTENIPNHELKVRGISKHTMKKTIASLSQKNLIVKTPNLLDMRRVFLKISEEGKIVVDTW